MAVNRDAPIYNIKAVVRLTGVAADTLRRWESRYSILSPQRSSGGYRMYSPRDVETIRWLKARVEEGLSISRACELLRNREEEGAGLPASAGPAAGDAATAAPAGGATPHTFPDLIARMLESLGRMEEAPAAQLLSEALALHSVEEVIDGVIYPALVEVGTRWARGDWSVGQEHFASAFVRGRLANLLHGSPFNAAGTLVLVACAPGELHEIGALILALYLRRAGHRVIYLGQNVPLESLVSMIRTLRPAAVCCSATRPDAAANLEPLAGLLAELHGQTGYTPVLAFGGSVFNRHPSLATQMGGIYLGSSGGEAIVRLRAPAA